MVYVCADLHGMYEAFLELLKEIEFTDQDELYILGDIVDRGPMAYAIYQYIKEKKNIYMLRGNHEQMMIDYVRRRRSDWFLNGGYKTITSIPYENNDELDRYFHEMTSYFEALPLYFVREVNGKKFIMVHAGVDYRFPLDKQKEMDLLWIREPFLEKDQEFENGIILYGHTPNRTVRFSGTTSDDIVFETYKIGLDGGACYGGQINCLRLDDLKAFKVKADYNFM